MSKLTMGDNQEEKRLLSHVQSLLWGRFVPVAVIFILVAQYPCETESIFTPSFVWSTINKTLEEDRLVIVDVNNEKVRVKWCTKVILYNKGSTHYAQGNYSGDALLIDASTPNFSSINVVDEVKERMDRINMGVCVPCIVVISIVNVTYTQEEQIYSKSNAVNHLGHGYWIDMEKEIQDYKFALSQEFLKLLQFRTPIQSRHLVLVRLVATKEELTKCHGKRFTKYPRRLVSIWEQVLFDHFKEARVIQGASENSETTLVSGKESGGWVWMCEEIIRRLELNDMCQDGTIDETTCQNYQAAGNLTTATIDMTDRKQCRIYRART